MMVQTTETALSHLRVLELGGRPASYTGHFLADLGADVILVEPPEGNSDRREYPFAVGRTGGDISLHFVHFNGNKRSTVLDLAEQDGRTVFLQLVERADILVESTPCGALPRWQLGPDDLWTRNPALIILSQSPFGRTGPYQEYKGNSAIAEAMSGFMYPGSGDETRAPCISPNEFLLQVAGLHGAVYCLAALHHARQGGKRQFIDMSLQEVGTHMWTGLSEYAVGGTIRRRPQAGRSVATQPSIFEAKDGNYVAFLPYTVQMWKAFAAWARDPVLSQPEWEPIPYRTAHQDVLASRIAAFVKRFDADELATEAQKRGIPSSWINRPENLHESPQVTARRSFIAMEHPELGTFRAIGYPFQMRGSPMRFRLPAPRLGQDQDAVLKDIAQPRSRPTAPPQRVTGGMLGGIRVLDFTRVIAGPVATQFFSLLGAEVIKVESAGIEGAARTPAPNFTDLNRGKKSITLDLRTPEGRALALRLVAKSDIVIDNFSPKVMERLGLGYETLCEVNPAVIAVGICGMGRDGPLTDWVAYGPTLEAHTGLRWLWRDEDAPVHAGTNGPPADYLIGAQAALATLAALEFRQRTGLGQFVDVNMLEGIAHTLGPRFLDAEINHRAQEPRGFQSERYAPFGCYPCAGFDARCVIACETDEEWLAFANAIGSPDLAHDVRFRTKTARIANRSALNDIVAAWTRARTPHQAMRLLQKAGVAAGVVQNAEDLFFDYHLRARQHVAAATHPAPWGSFDQAGMSALFSQGVPKDLPPAPLLGQQNAEIFGDLLGLSNEEVEDLQERRIIY